MFNLLFAVGLAAIVIALVVVSKRFVAWMESKGYRIPSIAEFVPALTYVLLVSQRSFAQSTLDLDIDLTNFWVGFNQFFNALFPPLAFIASISAALGFIFLIVRALKNAFGGAN